MIKKVSIDPDKFDEEFSLEVTVEKNVYLVVKISSPDGKIFKMFNWYLIRGTNVYSVKMFRCSPGNCRLHIIDEEGKVLYENSNLIKIDLNKDKAE